MSNSEGLVLDIRNRIGSVEHYYHFLLGFLAPLSQRLSELPDRLASNPIFVRSCGPFDSLLREIFGDQLRILPKGEHERLLHKARTVSGSKIAFETLHGFDNRRFYSASAFNSLRERLAQRLSAKLEQERAGLSDFASLPIKIAFVDRGNPDPFYMSGCAEKPTSGNVRRSIENFSACVDFLAHRGIPVRPCLLEGTSLAFQMALFDAADIIIAQHGAALTNIIWAAPAHKPDVIEIIPRDRQKPSDHFQALARCLGQKHYIIHQDHSHGAVDPRILHMRIAEIRRRRELRGRRDIGILRRFGCFLGLLG